MDFNAALAYKVSQLHNYLVAALGSPIVYLLNEIWYGIVVLAFDKCLDFQIHAVDGPLLRQSLLKKLPYKRYRVPKKGI